MSENIFFIAIDVDDNSFHGCGINKGSGEVKEFACRPTAGHLVKKLETFKKDGAKIKVCYEATYLGFSLQRDLLKKGIDCEVIAPSLIPELPGKKIKTDKLDTRKMAGYYVNGQLTKVHVPTEEEEKARDFVRSRGFMSRQMKSVKLYILSVCRRRGWHYKEENKNEKKDQKTQKKSHWTKQHRTWLDKKINEEQDEGAKYNMCLLLKQLDHCEEQLLSYDKAIEGLSEQEPYKKKVAALSCYRGIGVLTAMTLITELGDIKRFDHPRKLCSYAGMDLQEYSSGGHERRYHMSKMGNSHIRTSVIEACQMASKVPSVSVRLKEKRKNMESKYVEIADRCMKRLHQKSSRLLHAGKLPNKVKVACARELLCFVWESLRAAA